MKVLAFDTATTGCSAAVLVDGIVRSCRLSRMDRGQAEALNPMIGDVMKEAGLPYRDLDRVGVTIGPGAFTGVRIGIAAARALSLAAGIEAVGVSTFAALFAAVGADESAGRRVAIAVDGKRRDVFMQFFDDGSPAGSPFAVLPEDAAAVLGDRPVLLAGDGAPALHDALSGISGTDANALLRLSVAVQPPDAVNVARLAAAMAGGQPPRPAYIRPPDARRPVSAP